jgi:hypothetical protein
VLGALPVVMVVGTKLTAGATIAAAPHELAPSPAVAW